MSSTEWPSVDHHTSGLPTMVSSADLFDGELFGDELLDIYNSTVGDHHGVDGDHNGKHVCSSLVGGTHRMASNSCSLRTDIPNLLIPTDDHHDDDDKHPGVQVATTAAAIDDGLGAFRPSTSFNDLTTLLHPNGQVVVNPEGKDATKASKKRKSTAGDSSTPKKKGGARGGRKSSVKKQAVPPGAVAAVAPVAPLPIAMKEPIAEKKEAETPNPLGAEPPAAAAAHAPPLKELKVRTPATPRPSVSEKAASPVTPGDSNMDDVSEADFKQIAQAAVSNLIKEVSKEDRAAVGAEKVDTSTAHIKALTGNNWVQACSGSMNSGSSVSSATDSKNAAANNNRARRQNLTPDERARQNRDRNREHARNTRLRKKAYVEELKRTLTELVAQRDAAEFEKRQAAQRELEQREVRFRVIEEFLKLRGRNEPNFARWAAILEDGFSLTLPVTSFRKMVATGAGNEFGQVLDGVTNAMADASNLAEFLRSLGNKTEEPISLQYHCDRKNFFMDDCNAVLEWEASTVGAVKCGAKAELTFKGSFRGKFSPASNKLINALISFDTGLVVSQVRKVKDTRVSKHEESAAAVAAAHQADALLDSLQVPAVPSAVNIVPSSLSSSGSVKGEVSCDDDSESQDHEETPVEAMATRRTARRTSA